MERTGRANATKKDLANDQGELLPPDWLTELREHLSKREGTGPLLPFGGP